VKKPVPPKKAIVPYKKKEKKNHIPNDQQSVLKVPSNEVKFSDKASYSFNFEAEIQKIKIPIPLVELMKNEAFKKDILKTLDPKSISSSVDIRKSVMNKIQPIILFIQLTRVWDLASYNLMIHCQIHYG